MIGNEAYATNPLSKAVADASAVAAELSALGFTVTSRSNLDRSSFDAEVRRFQAGAAELAAEDATFFFYSGHAAQTLQGANLLIPVDTDTSSSDETRQTGIELQRLLAGLQGGDARVNVVVVDACRDWFQTSIPSGFRRGLSDLGRIRNVFLATSTSPGETADDGEGAHSPYTARLLEALSNKADEPLAALFDDVGAKVYGDTRYRQSPEFVSGLADEVSRWSMTQKANQPTAMATTPTTYPGASSAFLNSLSRERLLEFSAERRTFVDALLQRRDLLVRYQVSNPLRVAHFLALTSFETGRYRFRTERLNFSTSSLQAVGGTRFRDPATVQRYVGHPEMIANRLYANMIGNGDESSGDGWRYRGRGLLIMSGRDNYKRVSRGIGVDVEAAPDLMDVFDVALASALEIWSELGLDLYADNDDQEGLVRRVVGHAMQMPGRASELVRAKKVVSS